MAMEGLESRLDAVGFSYLDQVPISMNPVFTLSVDLDEINTLLNMELPEIPVHCPYDWEREKSALKTLLSEIEGRSIAQAEEVETLQREVQERLHVQQEKEKKELELQLSNLKCSPSSSSEESELPLQKKEIIPVKEDEPTPPPINYSEFEAAADPFESAELQTINELHELAACFPSVPQTSSKCYFPQPPPNNQQTFHQNYVPHPQHHELKSSKSFGDIVGEIKREENIQQNHYVKSIKPLGPSLTPPGSASKTNGLENWTPWPNLDTLNKEEDPFANLSEKERRVCSNLNEMGFAKPQLVKGTKHLGTDSQKLINFCLIVDELVSESNYPKEIAEDVVLKKDLDKEESRKYLNTFMELKELGFDSGEMCRAIEEAGYSKDEAIKILIKD